MDWRSRGLLRSADGRIVVQGMKGSHRPLDKANGVNSVSDTGVVGHRSL